MGCVLQRNRCQAKHHRRAETVFDGRKALTTLLTFHRDRSESSSAPSEGNSTPSSVDVLVPLRSQDTTEPCTRHQTHGKNLVCIISYRVMSLFLLLGEYDNVHRVRDGGSTNCYIPPHYDTTVPCVTRWRLYEIQTRHHAKPIRARHCIGLPDDRSAHYFPSRNFYFKNLDHIMLSVKCLIIKSLQDSRKVQSKRVTS